MQKDNVIYLVYGGVLIIAILLCNLMPVIH